jgi:glycosyltransferase involved in cell wall biosynthesis
MAPTWRQIESLRVKVSGMEVVELKGIPKLKYVSAYFKARRLAPEVDLIHAHYGYCGWLARAQADKPVVVSFMGSDLLGEIGANGRVGAFSRWMIQRNRRLAQLVDAVIVKSQEMADIVSPAVAEVIPNGVDIQRFRPLPREEARRRLGWTTGGPCVLFPGNPADPRKGYALAEAVVELANQKLQQPIELIKLWKVAPSMVPLFMNACNAMLMVSLWEGSPNVVKEAMACNVPILAAPVGDVASLLKDVRECRVLPRDPELLADALVDAIARDQPSSGREAIQQQGLDLESVADRVMAVYRRVLSNSSGGAP